MIIRDPGGQVLLVQGVQFDGVDDPIVIESLVLREAIIWCLSLGFSVVCFEGDAKVVIDKINQASTRDNQIGAILEEIVGFFALHSGLSVRFVGRSSNRVAHLVARRALSLYPASCRNFDFAAWLNSRM
ncbi:unnamed protein product [Linum trigynum]|uniref:RNase H type-1 domain-containing protein n=1 Tax=Linum trigynum TaxID=586398 RepID=A0AAV2GKM3_9ROSI